MAVVDRLRWDPHIKCLFGGKIDSNLLRKRQPCETVKIEQREQHEEAICYQHGNS